MDQMPVLLTMNTRWTLAFIGVELGPYCNTDHLTVRITVSLAVSANGVKLKPLVVFPGKPEGRNATGELEFELQDEVLICSQDDASQDQQIMEIWIDQILVPYLQEKAEGVPAILCLDEFKANKSDTTQAKLANIGIHLQLIPAGCNGFLQPVDISIRTPFKYRIGKPWYTWVYDGNEHVSMIPSPPRNVVTTWVADTWRDLDSNIIRDGWRKTDFSYF